MDAADERERAYNLVEMSSLLSSSILTVSLTIHYDRRMSDEHRQKALERSLQISRLRELSWYLTRRNEEMHAARSLCRYLLVIASAVNSSGRRRRSRSDFGEKERKDGGCCCCISELPIIC